MERPLVDYDLLAVFLGNAPLVDPLSTRERRYIVPY
jgi:hypothetical protein